MAPMEEFIRSWPNRDRAAHYHEQAAKLRDMAGAEATNKLMRERLPELSDQYARLAGRLFADPTPLRTH